MTESTKVQVNFKTGAGHDATLINIYADTPEEFTALLDFVHNNAASILATQQAVQSVGVVAESIPLASPQEQVASAGFGSGATPPQVVHPSTPAPASNGPEVISDRYGNRYTYGLADAPLLPDGRGHYVRKDWTSQNGKVLKAWVDPAKGPKPHAKGAEEAEILWIR